MDDERESVMMSAEEQKENDLQVVTVLTVHNPQVFQLSAV